MSTAVKPAISNIDLDDVQGSVLKGYALPLARYVFLHVADRDGGRRLLAELIGTVTTSQPWPPGPDGRVIRPPSTMNIAFTHAGLAALGVPARTLDGFPTAFREGMRARAASLGDVGPSAPEHWDWDAAWRDSGRDVHIWIALQAGDPDREVPSGDREAHAVHLQPLLDTLLAQVEAAHGVELLGWQDAGVLSGRRDHFGFRDGMSNPDIVGRPDARGTHVGRIDDEGAWAPLATGEFLLGHLDEANEIPRAPRPHDFSRNGTYLVHRKLHQNVGSWRRWLAEEGARYPGGPELLAAKVVGRWRDGTPLSLSPDGPDPTKVADNDFRYADDMAGIGCPLGSHVRRANPRDHLGFAGKLTNRHRLLRRGMAYGDPIAPDTPGDDDGEHGVVFIALNASIERQFEFVQREWMSYGNAFLQGNDKDPLVGAAAPGARFVIAGDPQDPVGRPTWVCADIPSFVETRGGEYFFMPSLTAMRHIAAGTVETI